MLRQITSLAVAVLGLVSLGFADTDVAAGATPASGTNPKPAGVRVFQEGSTRPPAALAGSPRAAALNAAARGRLQLDFVGDNAAAERALQDAVNEDDNPAASASASSVMDWKWRGVADTGKETG